MNYEWPSRCACILRDAPTNETTALRVVSVTVIAHGCAFGPLQVLLMLSHDEHMPGSVNEGDPPLAMVESQLKVGVFGTSPLTIALWFSQAQLK